MFTPEQEKYIFEHLRRPENDKAISEIASLIATEFQKAGGNVSPELAVKTALLMNLGETDSRISHIYESTCNWREHPEAIDLNKLHGRYSVEMAESIGIDLSEEQKSVIEGHSKEEYYSALGQIIKIAEVCRATESPRWYRGEKKDPAKSWDEVYSVLKEDQALEPIMITLAGNSYGKEHFSIQVKDTEKEI